MLGAWYWFHHNLVAAPGNSVGSKDDVRVVPSSPSTAVERAGKLGVVNQAQYLSDLSDKVSIGSYNRWHHRKADCLNDTLSSNVAYSFSYAITSYSCVPVIPSGYPPTAASD